MTQADVVIIGSAQGGITVPIRKALGLGRRVTDALCAQPSIGAIHIARHERDVLEPSIVPA